MLKKEGGGAEARMGDPRGCCQRVGGGATHQEGLRELLTDLLLALEVAPLGLGDQSNRAGDMPWHCTLGTIGEALGEW